MTKTTLNSNVNYEYTYDHLGRLNYYYLNLGANEVLVNPVYYASERNTDGDDTYQTTQIQREEIGDRGYAYTYDDVGNILTITEKKDASSSYTAKASYEYDALGQLTRENNVDLNQTIEYNYDNGGNLESKEIYDYSTELNPGTSTKIINYYYDDAWKDKLTGYTVTIDGETAQNVSITYDEIGNPLTYRDGMSFTWNGRQMATANLNGTTVEYKYDADGLRSYKKVGNTVHEYEYVGGQLVYEKRGDLKFYYRYNAMGELASIKQINSSGTEYTVYVVTNTRGDIEELRLASGTMVARYLYDTETGFYYLQSRYYDPETGRFLNADDVDFIGVSGNVLGYNAFAYCENNAVNDSDPNGCVGIDTVVGALFGVAFAVVGYFLSVLVENYSLLSKGISYINSAFINKIKSNPGSFILDVIFGAISGALSTTNKKKILNVIVTFVDSIRKSRENGETITGTVVNLIVDFILSSLIDTSQSFSKFNFKKVINSGKTIITKLKSVSRKKLKSVAKIISNQIIFYFKQNATLYSRYI